MSAAPIREAVIVRAPGDPLRPIARVPLLVRTILALERGGVARCTLAGDLPVPHDPRIGCALATATALGPAADDGLRIVVGTDTVIDRALVQDLQARARPGAAFRLEHAGAAVRVAPGPLVAADGGPGEAPRAGTLRRPDAPDVVAALLVGLENPRDGHLDRLFARRLSRPLSARVAATPIPPNAITLAGIALGVVGGLALALHGPLGILGGVGLLVASAILDCTDGEVARLRHAESRLGHWLDVAGDTVVNLAVLGGLVLRLGASGAAPGRDALAVLGTGILGAFAVITWAEETSVRRHRVPGWENRWLDGALGPLTTRDWQVVPVVFALAGRLDLLIPAAAIGAHAFWVTALILLRRALARSPS